MTLSTINNITVCGKICKTISSSIYNISCTIPKFINLPMLNYYNQSTRELNFHKPNAIFGDNPNTQSLIADGLLSTYYDSTNAYCSVVFDFQEGFLLQIKEIHYYPSTIRRIDDYFGITFQASNDQNVWVTLFNLDENIKTGWNVWEANSSISAFRFYKFTTLTPNHKSRCNLAEVKFFGLKYSTNPDFSGVDLANCESVLNFNGVRIKFPGTVQYRKDNTPVVNDVSPNMGPTSGGTNINIVGDGFGTNISNVQVLIDGISCNITFVTNQKISCVTNPR